jgi:hypothetical protein
MIYIRKFLIILAMGAVSFTTVAQEVYESVDEDGVVGFSDTPTPGAEEVEVHPNVIEVTPVNPPAAPPAVESSTGPAATDESALEPEEIYGETPPARDEVLEDEDQVARRESRDAVSDHPVNEQRGDAAGRAQGSGRR